MGKRTKWAVFQTGCQNGQQAHEKMLNITQHQENANQNHNEVLLHICLNDYHQEDKKQQVLARMW